MVAHRLGDGSGLAVVAGVIAAHDTLQFGKFTDHAACEIGLAQQGGAFGQRRIRADGAGDQAGERHDALHARALGAEVGVESDAVQRCNPAGEPGAAVEVPEMPRIGEAGAQHTLVAGDDGRTAVGRLDIGGEGEPGRHAAIPVAGREIALV